jgi:hypothetical protein
MGRESGQRTTPQVLDVALVDPGRSDLPSLLVVCMVVGREQLSRQTNSTQAHPDDHFAVGAWGCPCPAASAW